MTYQFWKINLIILSLCLGSLVEAKTPSKPIKKTVKVFALSQVEVRLGTRYKLNKTPVDLKISLQVNPSKKGTIKELTTLCSNSKLECQFYPSATQNNFINLYVLGLKSPVDSVLAYLKKNAASYKLLN